MGYGAYMQALLRPLGVYRLAEGNLNHSETEAVGAALDEMEASLEIVEREGLPDTAEGIGLERYTALFAHPPASPDVPALRQAIKSLLLIGGDSFTLGDIQSTIGGCGVSCSVEETETANTVRVSFPGTAGIPAGFARMAVIIESILPCHLAIDYFFRFMTWAICEEKSLTWGGIEAEEHTWETLIVAVN